MSHKLSLILIIFIAAFGALQSPIELIAADESVEVGLAQVPESKDEGSDNSFFKLVETIGAENILAACSLFVALLALIFSIWQGAATRKHNRLSLMPHLIFNFRMSNREKFVEIELVNSGTGIAFLEKVEYSLDSQILAVDAPRDLSSELPKFKGADFGMRVQFNKIDSGSSIPADSKKPILRLSEKIDPIALKEEVKERLNIRISFSTIYEKKDKIYLFEDKASSFHRKQNSGEQ